MKKVMVFVLLCFLLAVGLSGCIDKEFVDDIYILHYWRDVITMRNPQPLDEVEEWLDEHLSVDYEYVGSEDIESRHGKIPVYHFVDEDGVEFTYEAHVRAPSRATEQAYCSYPREWYAARLDEIKEKLSPFLVPSSLQTDKLCPIYITDENAKEAAKALSDVINTYEAPFKRITDEEREYTGTYYNNFSIAIYYVDGGGTIENELTKGGSIGEESYTARSANAYIGGRFFGEWGISDDEILLFLMQKTSFKNEEMEERFEEWNDYGYYKIVQDSDLMVALPDGTYGKAFAEDGWTMINGTDHLYSQSAFFFFAHPYLGKG